MIARPVRRRPGLGIVPLADILLIMLVFFMVTSTYLDLDAVPVAGPSETAGSAAPDPPGTRLLRITADDGYVLAGRPVARADLAGVLAAEADGDRLLVFPSAGASFQALVSALDAAQRAGIAGLELVTVGADP